MLGVSRNSVKGDQPNELSDKLTSLDLAKVYAMYNFSTTLPIIEDNEIFQDFADALSDRALELERDVARLKKTPGNRALMDDLFRAIHNIKGDASLCKFGLAVSITHPIETMLTRLRNGEISFSGLLAEAILLANDRLELATQALAAGKGMESLGLPALVRGLEKLAQASPDHVNDSCKELIEAVTGFPPVLSPLSGEVPKVKTPENLPNAASDLQFFRSLALQLESRSPLFRGRTLRILRLALETNQVAGSPVEPIQLEAAVCMHDIGMMFLPEPVWLKVGNMTVEDRAALRRHPSHAAGLLQRMPGWEAATEIVLQHHETPDGGGYPSGLKHEEISPGAKLLAIVDAFEAVMLKHVHRGRNRSVLRAIAEINACNNQFSAEWISPFNTVIRRSLEN